MSAPYMPLYVADYLGDTQHLSVEQSGCYLHLLMAMWRQGGSLPNEAALLSRICRLPAVKWARISGPIMEFFTIDGDRITQHRLAIEAQRYDEISERRRGVGKLGGESKALNSLNRTLANGVAKSCHSEPELKRDKISLRSADLFDLDDVSGSSQTGEAVGPAPISLDAGAFDRWWRRYPRKVGIEAARRAYDKAARKVGHKALFDGLERAVFPDDRKYVPHPATWLNQGRWADETAPTRQSFV